MKGIIRSFGMGVAMLLVLLCAEMRVSAGSTVAGGDVEIVVQSSLSEKADADDMKEQLEDDISRLRESGVPLSSNFTIYIGEGKTAFRDDGNLDCALSDMKNKSYRPFLTGAYCGVREPWIAYGISGCIFEEKTDKKFLASWYRNTENMDTLRLSGIRFFPEWVTEEEGKAVRQTAVSLASMLIGESGYDWINKPVDDSVKQRWLSSVGVRKNYEDKYAGYLDGYQFEAGEGYLVKISDSASGYTFYDHVDGAKTAEEVETFLYRERYGKEKIYNYLQEEGGSAFEEVIRKKEKIPFIRYTLRNDEESVSKVYGSRDQIALNNSVFGHLGHWLNSVKKTNGSRWSHGAFTTYINMIYAEDDYFGDNVQKFLQTGNFFSNDLDKSGTTDEAVSNYMEKYLAGGDISINRAMVDACAAAELFDKMPLNRGMDVTYQEMYRLKDEEMREGDELTLVQAASFFAWLTDHYSLEKTLQLCISEEPDYADIFHASYDELKMKWQESLRVS